MASEDAESMHDLFRGTEEEIERMYKAVIQPCTCEFSDVLFVAYEKRWLHDGKGLMASKSVSVIFFCRVC